MTEPTPPEGTKPPKVKPPKADKPEKQQRPRRQLPNPAISVGKLTAILQEVDQRVDAALVKEADLAAGSTWPPELVRVIREAIYLPLVGTGYHPDERALADLKEKLAAATSPDEIRALMAEVDRIG